MYSSTGVQMIVIELCWGLVDTKNIGKNIHTLFGRVVGSRINAGL